MLTKGEVKSIVIGILNYMNETGNEVVVGKGEKAVLLFTNKKNSKKRVTLPIVYRYDIDKPVASSTVEEKVQTLAGMQKVTLSDLANTIKEVEKKIVDAIKDNKNKIPDAYNGGVSIGGLVSYPYIDSKKVRFQYELSSSMRQLVKDDMRF